MLVYFTVFETNGPGPATVRFNGAGPTYTIKTNSGNNPSEGGLLAGCVVLGGVSGSNFRLLSDQASDAIVAAAEAAQTAAEQARDEAEAFAASIDPSAYYSKTASDARYAPISHTHLAANITDFATAVAALAPVAHLRP